MSNIIESLLQHDAPFSFDLGPYQKLFESALEALEEAQATRRIWARDGTLWQQSPQAVAEIENRLGWLDLPFAMRDQVSWLQALTAGVLGDDITHVILLGMGGSSLAAEVMRLILGRTAGYPELTILDSTDPAQIRHAAEVAPLSRTLFIVASKSGLTAEVAGLFAYFKAALLAEVGESWKKHMLAVTDPGTKLATLAQDEGFRALFLNPPDIGGRYSALSFFGLLPAALVGVDLNRLLGRAADMAGACGVSAPAADNPGLVLGTAMGELARQPYPGRDKLTILASPELAPFGAWAEQLVAESTGKEGLGILPVEGELLKEPGQYGSDRFFIYLRLDAADNIMNDAQVAALIELGHPLVVLRLRDVYDLGAELFRWEFATAVACQRLGVNPFDQPDVESAKVQARNGLAHYEETRTLAEEPPVLHRGALALYGPASTASDADEYLGTFLSQAKQGDYVALMAYIERNEAHRAILQQVRCALSEKLGAAVTVGFGPRFLHSTGQLHKGGRNAGLFLQLTQDEPDDLAIPGRPYTFGVLKRAQALGDLQALRAAGRRVLRVNLGVDAELGLCEFSTAIGRAMQASRRVSISQAGRSLDAEVGSADPVFARRP
jgi:glucose-6-phosphate isomerase